MVFLHYEVAAYVQPQTSAFPGPLGREEGIKDLRLIFPGDTLPVVLDLDNYPGILPSCRMVSVPSPSIASTALSMMFVHT